MADGYIRVEGWAPELQPGTVTVVSVEDRDASEVAAAAALAAQEAAEAARDIAVAAADDASEPIPDGGNTGQVLAKRSGLTRDVQWVDPVVGGSGGGTVITGAPAAWPSTFPASAHSHPSADISDMTAIGRLLAKANTQQEGRAALGAGTGNGTSNLQLGPLATQAAQGNHSHQASAIAFTPTGDVSATNLQDAVTQAAALGGGGSDTGPVVELYYSGGSYPTLPASYPAYKKRLHYFGPVAPPTTLPTGILFKSWTAQAGL